MTKNKTPKMIVVFVLQSPTCTTCCYCCLL